ncbi:hypothetical protein LPTSP2_34890 [Leptospira ellinghausenii]|uniref:Uncharacterized protein n=1 Tax=Leptospira ellinghausenii TaxID=1917822 RepID=A0A2P2DHR9_9LEPT|nr:hypothetical protein LPTSP2_34890 [Leptospira ellinghausenii]
MCCDLAIQLSVGRGFNKETKDPRESDQTTNVIIGLPIERSESGEDWSDSKTIGQSQLSFLSDSPACVWWQGGSEDF